LPSPSASPFQRLENTGFIPLLRKGIAMDGTTIIRIVAGVLFVIVLGILIQRRRTKVN